MNLAIGFVGHPSGEIYVDSSEQHCHYQRQLKQLETLLTIARSAEPTDGRAPKDFHG